MSIQAILARRRPLKTTSFESPLSSRPLPTSWDIVQNGHKRSDVPERNWVAILAGTYKYVLWIRGQGATIAFYCFSLFSFFLLGYVYSLRPLCAAIHPKGKGLESTLKLGNHSTLVHWSSFTLFVSFPLDLYLHIQIRSVHYPTFLLFRATIIFWGREGCTCPIWRVARNEINITAAAIFIIHIRNHYANFIGAFEMGPRNSCSIFARARGRWKQTENDWADQKCDNREYSHFIRVVPWERANIS